MGAPIILHWARFCLALTTFFIALSFISRPPENQCQMTFMMEPPKFIPIPIDELKTQSSRNQQHNTHARSNQYTLFMYSEYGFPMESDVKRDLKDSMPILFVPGNAGSYQQVRSLASTCIRRQLQSLDAFKFIFYTIDFKAQLSGISGKLINQQIDFVNSALEQISKMHSEQTNGVIVVGHSVGGFITKALLAREDFNHDLVPLMINLASPLTQPYVNFDDEMRELYNDSNSYWSSRGLNQNTLAISISGGKLDRLVPMHLSLDPQYDLSLTTNSVNGVWLTTDHVSITWCRELMHRLAKLLSALMDRRYTRLISDKFRAINIIKDQMQTTGVRQVDVSGTSVVGGQRLVDSAEISQLTDYLVIKRDEMLRSNMIVNLTAASEGRLMIWLEHLDEFKETCLYFCESIKIKNGQPFCERRLDMINLAQTIPSRRFELKRKLIMLNDNWKRFKYLALEFAVRSRGDMRKNYVPEMISLQVIKDQSEQILAVPTLTQYLFRRLLFPSLLSTRLILPNKVPLTYTKLTIKDLIQSHQYYLTTLETGRCKTSDKSGEALILLLEGNNLRESTHPDKVTSAVISKLSSHRSIMSERTTCNNHVDLSMDIFLDGTCENFIRIEFDWWSFIEDMIQRRSVTIMACASYMNYVSLMTQSWISNQESVGKGHNYKLRVGYVIAGYLLVYSLTTEKILQTTHTTDHIVTFVAIFLFSNGLIALFEMIIKRVFDLGIIAFKFSSLLRRATSSQLGFRSRTQAQIDDVSNGHDTQRSNQDRSLSIDPEWLFIIVTVVAAPIFSEMLFRICAIFIITMSQLRLTSTAGTKKTSPSNGQSRVKSKDIAHYHGRQDNNSFQLLIHMATLSALCIIGNIPALLLKINSLGADPLVNILSLHFLTSATSLFAVKIICSHVGSKEFEVYAPMSFFQQLRHLKNLPKWLHVVVLVPISSIPRSICNMNLVDCIVFIWVARGLISESEEAIKKAKKND